ncbi:MAG: hypothetical protein K6E98_07355 [Lachnospiraceae bacterium]|nr:hypothetical protein [Lachnospiraceae bacterium]
MSTKRNKILNIIIVLLTVILFIMLIALQITTDPKRYGPHKAESSEQMLKYIDREYYPDLYRARIINELRGTGSDNDPSYKVVNSAADYFYASFCYNAYDKCGKAEEAAEYKKIMDTSSDNLKGYEYIVKNIDNYINDRFNLR